jgi:2,4-dienoyl-CoA reductase-like NADH-dependent reductase (Old Yellow Enzyme family)
VEDWVGVTGFKLNKQLAHYVRNNPLETKQPAKSEPAIPSYHKPRWRIRDRLSKQDIADIVAAFKHGTAKHVLAERYGINLRSLKKLLREESVKRKSWNDIQA